MGRSQVLYNRTRARMRKNRATAEPSEREQPPNLQQRTEPSSPNSPLPLFRIDTNDQLKAESILLEMPTATSLSAATAGRPSFQEEHEELRHYKQHGLDLSAMDSALQTLSIHEIFGIPQHLMETINETDISVKLSSAGPSVSSSAGGSRPPIALLPSMLSQLTASTSFDTTTKPTLALDEQDSDYILESRKSDEMKSLQSTTAAAAAQSVSSSLQLGSSTKTGQVIMSDDSLAEDRLRDITKDSAAMSSSLSNQQLAQEGALLSSTGLLRNAMVARRGVFLAGSKPLETLQPLSTVLGTVPTPRASNKHEKHGRETVETVSPVSDQQGSEGMDQWLDSALATKTFDDKSNRGTKNNAEEQQLQDTELDDQKLDDWLDTVIM